MKKEEKKEKKKTYIQPLTPLGPYWQHGGNRKMWW